MTRRDAVLTVIVCANTRSLDVGDVVAGTEAEVEPAEELAGSGRLRRPGAEPVKPVVDREMEGDDPVPDFLAGRRPAAGKVAHHLRVAVQVEQVADV
jgi:hypothetical protein